MKKTILLIEDDPKTEAAIRETLGKEYLLQIVKNASEASTFLKKKTADLLLIDFDLKTKDGLQIYRELRPQQRVVMLSASGNVPLAVTATKQGVMDFLRKPINAQELKDAIEKNIRLEDGRLRWPAEMEWLQGPSAAVQNFSEQVSSALKAEKDILLLAEAGIPRGEVARFIHLNSSRRNKRMEGIDLLSFSREDLEAHFWANIKKLLSLPEASSLQRLEDICGTLYLDNLERVDEHFRLTVLDYFKASKKDVRVIFGASRDNFKTRDYAMLEVPSLKNRKEDLPHLLEFYLRRANERYNKKVAFISAEVLDFLAGYEFPGNYLELEKMIEEAVLIAKNDKLRTEDFTFDSNKLIQILLERALKENLTLEEARIKFEKGLYKILMKKTDNDEAALARFMDMPKSALVERLQNFID